MSKKLVVDSSVVIALSRRGTLERNLKGKKDQNFEIVIPEAIARELLDEAKKLSATLRRKRPVLANKISRSVESINSVMELGLLRVEPLDYRAYSQTIDNVRKYLSRLEAKKEHAVKKGDPELIALIIQLYDTFGEKVFIASEDKGLLRALRHFSKRIEYEHIVIESHN